MSELLDLVTKAEESKEAIRVAINNKGGELTKESKLDSFSEAIDNINTKGPFKIEYVDLTKSPGQTCSIFTYAITSIDLSGFITNKWTSLNQFFSGCVKLTSINMDGWDTSNVTNMVNMFTNCSSLKEIDLSSFDTSSLKDMNYMFYQTKPDVINLTGWNTSKVTNMGTVFGRCYVEINEAVLGLSDLDTSKVTSMANMFYDNSYCVNLDCSWMNLASCTNMNNIFQWMRGLDNNDATGLQTLNLDGLDFSTVTQMSNWLQQDYKLVSILGTFTGLGNKVNTINCNTRYNASHLSHLSADSISNVISGLVDKTGASGTFTLQLASENKSIVTDEIVASATDKNWTIAYT